MARSVVTESHDLVGLYPNVTHVKAINCRFNLIHGNQYNIFPATVDPSTNFGRFSFADLFPQRVSLNCIDCSFELSRTNINVYRSLSSADDDAVAQLLCADPTASHVVLTDLTLNIVGHGTRYHIFPFRSTATYKDYDIDYAEDRLFCPTSDDLDFALGPMVVEGGTILNVSGTNFTTWKL
jgi:hypothetical protein